MPSTHRQSSLFNWLDKSSSSSLQSVHNPAIAKSEPRTPRTLKTPTTPRIPKIPRTLKTALTPRQIVAQMLPKSIMTPKVFKTPRSIGRTTGMMKKTEPVCAICTKELIEMVGDLYYILEISMISQLKSENAEYTLFWVITLVIVEWAQESEIRKCRIILSAQWKNRMWPSFPSDVHSKGTRDERGTWFYWDHGIQFEHSFDPIVIIRLYSGL